jgi:hypothetical protein
MAVGEPMERPVFPLRDTDTLMMKDTLLWMRQWNVRDDGNK